MRRSRITEGSCWRCRQRRVKCDLLKPTCTRCQDSGQICGYGAAPFKWVGGMALRGKNAPATSEFCSPPPSSSPSNTADARRPSDSSSPRRSSEGSSDRRLSEANTDMVLSEVYSPPLELVIAVPAAPPLDESQLMPYFANAVIPRFLLGDGFIPVDYDTIIRDDSLQKAVLAVSRAHYDLLSKTRTSSTALVRNTSRHLAIAAFRKHLVVDTATDSNAKDLFASNVLLCMLDGMIEPSNESNASSMHLKGGFAMLNRWPSTITNMLFQGGLQSHLLSVFVTMDLVHSLLSGRKPYFESLIFYMYANTSAWWGLVPAGDRLLDLFKALSEMAALGSIVFSHLPTQNGILLAEKCLPAVQALLETPPDFPTSPSDTIRTDHWTHFCCLFEISGSIYIQRALRNKDVDDEAVQAYTRRGVSMLMEDLLPGMLQHCLILPMLVIGAHCIHVQDRRAIDGALSPTVAYLSFGNLPLMHDFLRDTWERGNLKATWWDVFSDVAEKVFLF